MNDTELRQLRKAVSAAGAEANVADEACSDAAAKAYNAAAWDAFTAAVKAYAVAVAKLDIARVALAKLKAATGKACEQGKAAVRRTPAA